jgi:hypothetical protein
MFPGKSFDVALSKAQQLRADLFPGAVYSTTRIQLCPQTRDHTPLHQLTSLKANYPDVTFQLHANVKRDIRFEPFDTSVDFSDAWAQRYVDWLKEACELLDAPSYSWHASGGRQVTTLTRAFDNTRRLQDFLQRPVALEGLYPSPFGWAMSTVSDYETLLDADIDFVIDVSHLLICHRQDRLVSDELLLALLSCPRCTEVHLSHNDGLADQHCDFPPGVLPFGWNVFRHAWSLNSTKPTVFLESRVSSLKV